MRVFNAQDIDAALSFPALVDVLADAFRSQITAPPRHHHDVPLPGRPNATLLLMPAWNAARARAGAGCGGNDEEADGDDFIGIKTIAVIPDNGARGLAAVQGSYLLLSGVTGQPLALMDAPRLTNWRTAAASALASNYLSRTNSSKLLMVGAGGLAPFLIRAHASLRLTLPPTYPHS
jgi:ornithine cyclodeaminase